MSIFKKIALSLSVISVLLIGISSVYASTYATKVTLGNGATVTGALRNYTAGTPWIEYQIYSINGNSTTKFAWTVMDEDGYPWFTEIEQADPGNVSLNISIGPESVVAGKYRFNFTTKIKGQTYKGVTLDPLYLKTV